MSNPIRKENGEGGHFGRATNITFLYEDSVCFGVVQKHRKKHTSFMNSPIVMQVKIVLLHPTAA